MTSWRNRAAVALIRLAFHPATATRERGLRTLTRGRPPAPPPRGLRGRVVREHVCAAGPHPDGVVRTAVDRVEPGAGAVRAPGAAVVYLHGGAFVHGIRPAHWRLVADLADATGAPVFVPHYGRAPEHTADELDDLVVSLVDHVTRSVGGDGRGQGADGAPSVRIHLAGDSAGGTLALLAAQQLRGDERVVGVTLISPALDLTQSNPGIPAVERHDPWLSRAGTRPLLEAWAGERPLDHPGVSPVRGELAGLPPLHVFAGTRDICWPDVEVLERRAREAGTPVTVRAAAGSPHVHVLLPTPEGRGDRATLLTTVAESVRR